MTLRASLLTLILLTLNASAAETAKTLRVYFFGNSVTDTIRYESFAELAASRGHQLIWGRHTIPGPYAARESPFYPTIRGQAPRTLP